jgi:hypothetical protein
MTGCSKEPKICCMALTAGCLACAAGTTQTEYCKSNPITVGCEQTVVTKPSKTDAEKRDEIKDNVAQLETRRATSSRSCAELGWAAKMVEPLTEATVCGGSEIEDASSPSDAKTCFKGRQAKGAMNLCESIGARLCTAKEALAQVTAKTGCSLDNKWFWTGSECGTTAAGDKKFTLVKSNKQKSKCKKPNKSKAVRCCADVL